MIITFCGHAQFQKSKEYEQKILTFLETKIGNDPADLYLGGYGSFDAFAYECEKKYKATHPNVTLVFVTPYFTPEYQQNHLEYQKTKYDVILYPELENVPPKFAISHRNLFMVEKADYVIAYIDHAWGGAYQTYRHAKRKNKIILNLAQKEIL